MATLRIFPTTCLILASSIATLSAELYTSANSGLWEAATATTWNPEGNPQTGTTDSVSIGLGHIVEFSGNNTNVGLPGSNDLGTANGQTISIDGGVLTQSPANYWIRIGHGSEGTLNINDGRFHFTNSTASAAPKLQIGIRGGTGFVKVGDGTGDAGSAILNLRDIVDGTANGANVDLNLGATEGGNPNGLFGRIVINSDGVLEGDTRNGAGNNPVIRVGQGSSTEESSITVNAGGVFNAHGTVEIGSEGGSKGLIRLTGAGATMNMDAGEFNIGFNGAASFIVENDAVYSRTNTDAERLDILIGRETASVANVIVQNNGQFLRGPGSNVGDMRIGLRGKGTMTISSGGLVQNDSGNWDWIGQETGSNGTLIINEGGTFRTTGGSNLVIGLNPAATGLVHVNGGNLELQSGSAAEVRIGQYGNGTFRQTSGYSDVRHLVMAENTGTANFELLDGMMNVRAGFYMGGAGTGSAGNGTATGTQSGGTLTIGGAFVVGLATAHTATYNLNGGSISHTGSDISVGESGTGTLHIGVNGTLDDTSGGQFYVGRNEGSSGTLIVDGQLNRPTGSFVRVGNGNSNEGDNTTAPGLLGGKGTINSSVRIGAHGTLTAGTLNTVENLTLNGDLVFSPNGTLFVNFGANGTVDRFTLTGFADITGALLDGDWTGGITGLLSRYWLLVNDDIDPITGTFANVSLTSPSASIFPDADAWTTIDGQEFAIFYDANYDANSFTGGNDLLLAAVPEPSVSLLLGSGLALAFARRRRKG